MFFNRIRLIPHMKRFLAGALCAMSVAGAYAADFFSTEPCDELLTFGARIGVNTSNRTMCDNAYPDCYHNESWGAGFDLGVVANLNIRDYLAIQPGFFFETRSGSYVLMGSARDSGLPDDGTEMAQAGCRNSYNFTIPVLAIFRFNVMDDIRWNVEVGPYISFVLDSKLKNKRFVVDGPSEIPLFMQKAAPVDFGFKMGTSVDFLEHYYFGIHYMAGCVPAWKEYDLGNISKKFGGVTKAWTFTIGYNF